MDHLLHLLFIVTPLALVIAWIYLTKAAAHMETEARKEKRAP